MLSTVACRAPYPETHAEQLIRHARQATVRLSVPGRSCSAFHVGNDVFVTAAHCLHDQGTVFLQALDGESYLATPVIVDMHLDLATIHSDTPFVGGQLELWSPSDGPMKRGAELVACGFPGYYELEFIFEVGWLKDFLTRDGVKMLVSSNLGYPGHSGGPVLSLQTGHVVGVNDLMSERISNLEGSPGGPALHQHNTLALLVAATEVQLVLERTEVELEQTGGP